MQNKGQLIFINLYILGRYMHHILIVTSQLIDISTEELGIYLIGYLLSATYLVRVNKPDLHGYAEAWDLLPN